MSLALALEQPPPPRQTDRRVGGRSNTGKVAPAREAGADPGDWVRIPHPRAHSLARGTRGGQKPLESRHQYNGIVHVAEQPAALAALLGNRRAFLRYLQGRVSDRALAEDILQEAFAKVIAQPGHAPANEAIVPWFYRTLRNAAVDEFRRRGAIDRAYQAFARELDRHEAPADDLTTEICACVSRLAAMLKPEYAEALQAIEVAGTSVKAFAEQKGLSPSNAAVRVFRAREALKKRVTESCGMCAEHGCVNCTCTHASSSAFGTVGLKGAQVSSHEMAVIRRPTPTSRGAIPDGRRFSHDDGSRSI